jgi:hypothetical protein
MYRAIVDSSKFDKSDLPKFKIGGWLQFIVCGAHPCAKMFLLTLGRDPIEGLFLKFQFGPPADLAAAHKWWCLSDWHHRLVTIPSMMRQAPR